MTVRLSVFLVHGVLVATVMDGYSDIRSNQYKLPESFDDRAPEGRMIDATPGDIFRKGQVLNNTYEIDGVLGSGGTGEVYRATNQITGRVVAIKAIKREFAGNAEYLDLMKREEEMRAISHDAVVRYTDCSRTADGRVFLVMDYVDGTALSEFLDKGGLSARDLLVVAHRVAEGLVATHARKIVHRDLSPDNIILRNGRPEEAVIIDFGIAKDSNLGAKTIVGNDFAGKYEYAAPEQVYGRAEPRSDLYALGASLLATFRRRVPTVGSSPGEIVEVKEKPLDTAGVPDPLKSVIELLAHPDPARRPASAAIAAAEIEKRLRSRGLAGDRREPAPRRRWTGLAAAAVVLLALGGAGAWYAGLADPWLNPLPEVKPYRLAAALADTGGVSVEGHAPDREARAAILKAVALATGEEPPPDAIGLAKGAPSPTFGADVAAMLGTVRPLEDWSLALSDRETTLTGTAPDAATRKAVTDAYVAAAKAAGYGARATVAAGPRVLPADVVKDALGPLATCGPLTVDAPADGRFPLGATLAVAGNVAKAADIAAIETALAPKVGDRTVRVDAAVLDEGLCTVVALLPRAEAGSTSLVLGWGDRDAPNLSGVYATGDNPTIDVLMPASDAGGYLTVFIADVTGNLFNILPNVLHPENAVAGLGTVDGGMRDVRVAWSLAEQKEDRKRLSFTVDDTFGKSLVVALRTDAPLFPVMRPTTESIESFANDARAALADGQVKILSVSTRLIDTRR